jgi:hypothetical protein
MIPKTADMIKSLMAGKGIEGPDFLGKGGALAGGLAMAGGFAQRNITDPALYRIADKYTKAGGWAGNKWYDPRKIIGRSLTSYGIRSGAIQTPSPTGAIRRRNTFNP